MLRHFKKSLQRRRQRMQAVVMPEVIAPRNRESSCGP
ncbi:hypothetical protein ACJIZ3_017188 [Penstemon smallii]|uniref:Uncharacterized protein n=1 Tax=Penstemon smallii TaxID=265156 RepID=A0ABD3SVK1_9LAMI